MAKNYIFSLPSFPWEHMLTKMLLKICTPRDWKWSYFNLQVAPLHFFSKKSTWEHMLTKMLLKICTPRDWKCSYFNLQVAPLHFFSKKSKKHLSFSSNSFFTTMSSKQIFSNQKKHPHPWKHYRNFFRRWDWPSTSDFAIFFLILKVIWSENKLQVSPLH
jgi:hypothetical protein